MKTTCWIIFNGFLPGEEFRDFAKMIQKAAIDRGHDAIIYKNNELISLLAGPSSLMVHPNISLPDYVVCTDKDIYLAKQLELLGVPVFNSASTIEISDDKIKTYQVLAQKNISIPKTVIAPKTFGLNVAFDENYFKFITEHFDFPLIVKEAFGSFGEQVYLIKNETELRTKINLITGKPFVIQEFIESSYGKDLRVQVVGDEVVTTMMRTSKDDFRANVTSGGTMQFYTPNAYEKKIAVQAAKAIQADFAGVDLLFGNDGQPIVCE